MTTYIIKVQHRNENGKIVTQNVLSNCINYTDAEAKITDLLGSAPFVIKGIKKVKFDHIIIEDGDEKFYTVKVEYENENGKPFTIKNLISENTWNNACITANDYFDDGIIKAIQEVKIDMVI